MNSLKITFFLIINVLLSISKGQSQFVDFEWVKQMGDIKGDHPGELAIGTSGQIYTAWFGNYNYTHEKRYELPKTAYLSSYSSNGSLDTVVEIKGRYNYRGMGLATDRLDNVYCTYQSEKENYSVVAKRNAKLELVWERSFGRTKAYARDLDVDADGSAVISGFFNGKVDFDPGIDTFFLEAKNTGYLYESIYFSRFDSAGTFQWAKKIPALTGYFNYDRPIVKFGKNGDIYLACSFFRGSIDVDPGPQNVIHSTKGNNDIFVAKYDEFGNYLWSQHIGDAGYEYLTDMVIDSTGAVYLCGAFEGAVDFDPGPNVYELGQGGESSFIVKLSSTGRMIWAGGIQDVGQDWFHSLALDEKGNLYATGYSFGDSDFDFGSGVWLESATVEQGHRKGFILKLDTGSNFEWVKTVGSNALPIGFHIAADEIGNVYTLGSFGTGGRVVLPTNFDHSGGELWLTERFSADVFLHKTSQCNVFGQPKTVTACDEIESPSGNYLWTKSGVYFDTIASNLGCDSLLTITTNINYSITRDIVTDACFEYLSPSGKNTWTTSGYYLDTLTRQNGCDSILSIDLRIEGDSSKIILNGSTLTAVPSGMNYQWLDCGNDFNAIPGATSRTFQPSVSGDYAVMVLDGFCVDTSQCQSVIVSSVPEIFESLAIFPNPISDFLIIEGQHDLKFSIVDQTGRVLLNGKSQKGRYRVNTRDLMSGHYLVRLESDQDFVQFNMVKL